MKEGETYWIFAGEKIKSFVFEGYGVNGEIWGRIDENTRVLVRPEDAPLFESREALCEHYRKIFE